MDVPGTSGVRLRCVRRTLKTSQDDIYATYCRLELEPRRSNQFGKFVGRLGSPLPGTFNRSVHLWCFVSHLAIYIMMFFFFLLSMTVFWLYFFLLADDDGSHASNCSSVSLSVLDVRRNSMICWKMTDVSRLLHSQASVEKEEVHALSRF